jgi:hypothetical protein
MNKKKINLLLKIIFISIFSCTEMNPSFNVDKDISNGKCRIITYGMEFPFPNNFRI